MKAKQKETIKAKSLAELQDMLAKAKEKQFNLLFKHSTTPLSNPLEIRVVRREIALLTTLINQKSAADGQSK
jgi:large subunit ribosomal protein L29